MEKEIKEKIILLLVTGLALSFSRSGLQHYRVYKEFGREWGKINKRKLQKKLQELYRSKVIKEKRNPDGTFTFVLSDKGKIKALTYRFAALRIKEKVWDRKWRMVFFDVPEKHRWGRDALRRKLRELGFLELQKSVLVFPYECGDEIDFIIEYYGIRKYARFAVIEHLDDDVYLKEKFGFK